MANLPPPRLTRLDLTAPLGWEPPPDWRRVVAIDSHTGGEPFRVVVEGLPDIHGATMLERRRFAEAHFDDLRRSLMWEPRGHRRHVRRLRRSSRGPFERHLGPLHPQRRLLHDVWSRHHRPDQGRARHRHAPGGSPETVIRIDTPAGQIEATAQITAGVVQSVSFRNVPSFVAALDQNIDVPGLGKVRYDLAFGGAFYAYVAAADLGLSIDPSSTPRLIEAGRAIKQAVVASGPIEHPMEPGLGFLYGVIFVGPAQDPEHHSRNVCIFADGEVDRSPTGTGVSGRLAIHHARGEVATAESITVESILGSTSHRRVVETTDVGGVPAVIPEVSGTAYITGRSELWLDPADEFGGGFLVR